MTKNLKIEEKDVVEMNKRLSGPEKSLNAPISNDDKTEKITLLEEKDENQEIKLNKIDENNKRKELLIKALDNLNEREKDIFVKRCLNDPSSTLEKLSKIYNVSRERIRQIEVRSFEKVKKMVLEKAIEENKEILIKKKN